MTDLNPLDQFIAPPIRSAIEQQYQTFAIQPWMPVGVTGVIRGSIRNAAVVAEQDLWLLAIPKDVFLKHWHHTYNSHEFAQLFATYSTSV